MEHKYDKSTQPLNLEETEGMENLFATDEDVDRASRSLKAMSHPLRLKIL
ncbi:MAG: ArsR family transcriptional regulator, partial [Candidatus Thiodiazotropha sp.]